MTEWQHEDAARGRWQKLSLAEQFGNVGSEISRAIRWSTKNPETAQAALYRGLELFDLMLDDPRHRGSVARLREIARAREVVVDFLAGSNEYGSTGPSLQSTSISSPSPLAGLISQAECPRPIPVQGLEDRTGGAAIKASLLVDHLAADRTGTGAARDGLGRPAALGQHGGDRKGAIMLALLAQAAAAAQGGRRR